MGNKRSAEHGQIVVLLALLLVGILAFTALAVDGGLIFSNRRVSQNSADAASLTGATKAGEYLNNYSSPSGKKVLYPSFDCTDSYIGPATTLAENSAIASASKNSFTLSKDNSAESRVEVKCVDNGSENPPYNKYLEVRVWITTETDSSFAHLFYSGPLKGTVEAHTRVYPGYNVGMGQGIIATCHDINDPNKDGIIISGTANAVLKNSGAFSNCALNANGGGSINATGGSINYNTVVDGDADNFSPDPVLVDYQYTAPASDAIVKESDCGSSQSDPKTGNNKTDTINPGTYSSITQTGGVLNLNPGLYCITGTKGVSTTGGAIIGHGVTFFMINGGFKIAGNEGTDKDNNKYYTELEAPMDDADRDLRWFGYLVVMSDANAPAHNPLKYDIDITGTSKTIFSGTIFAPLHDVKLTGNSDTQSAKFGTQVIGNTVTLAGTPLITVEYDADHSPYFEPSLDLQK